MKHVRVSNTCAAFRLRRRTTFPMSSLRDILTTAVVPLSSAMQFRIPLGPKAWDLNASSREGRAGNKLGSQNFAIDMGKEYLWHGVDLSISVLLFGVKIWAIATTPFLAFPAWIPS